jgi:iron complex outermembrane receptor protein
MLYSATTLSLSNQTVYSKFSVTPYNIGLGLLLLLPFPMLAQARPASGKDCGLTLSGKVTDHDQREPLQGAVVYIEELQLSTATDAFGNYHFHHLCEGTYRLRSNYLGYEGMQADIRLRSSSVRDFKMHSSPTLLQGVEVTGRRLPPPTTQASAQLAGRQLSETRGLPLAEALTRLTGVNSIQTGPTIAKPVIHGLHSNRVLLLNNGVRHEAQQWGAEHAPEIDPFVASQLTVVKGAATVRYGSDAIGGVVLVEPAPLRDSAGVGGEVNLVGMTNSRLGAVSAMVEGNAASRPAFSWRLQGSLKRAGDARTPNYYLNNTGVQERNFSAALGYTTRPYGGEVYYSHFSTRLGILAASHIGNLTDLRRAIERGHPEQLSGFTYEIDAPYQEVRHHLLKASGFVRTGDAGRLRLIYAGQLNSRDEYDAHSLRTRVNPELHYEIMTHTADLIWEHAPVGNISGSVGLTGITQQNTYQGRFFIPFFRNYTGAAFAIERWRKDKLQLEAGVRYDHKLLQVALYEQGEINRPEFRFGNLSGSIGGIYDFAPHWTLSVNTGTAFRAPGANELFSGGLHHGAAAVELGNRELVPERAYNSIATLSYRHGLFLNGEVSVYNNYIQNYIYLAPQLPPTLTIRGAYPTFAYRQTDARFRGIDASLEVLLVRNLSLVSKGSLVRAKNRSTHDYLVMIPPDRLENMLRYQVETSESGSSRFANTYLSLGMLLVARQTRVPANPEEQDFAAPPAGYALLQAEAGTQVRIGRQRLDIGLSGTNLLNTLYRDYLNRFRYFADERGRNIVLRVRVPLKFS